MIATANTLEREALAAVDRGWALTPVRGKIPIRRGWQKESPADRETVIRWSREYDGLGVRTGQVSGVVVVDVDTTELPNWLPSTVTAQTPRGGYHAYFLLPADAAIHNTADASRKIDVRGTGGQVVSVGSTLADGRQYTWLAGHSPDEVALAVLPAKSDASIMSFLRNCHDLAHAQPGGRNHKLNESAFKLGQHVAAGDLDRSAAERSLTEAARQCGLGDYEITKTLASGLNSGMSNTSSATLATLKLSIANPATAPSSTDRSQGKPQAFAHTDLGNSERLIHEHGEHLRYTDAMGWLRWTGTHFERDDADAVDQYAKETVRAMYAQAGRTQDPKARASLADWAVKSESRKRITDMVALARSDPAVRISHDELDADPWLMTVQNGTLDLRTGELRQHDTGDLITKCCPVDYQPDAPAECFSAFLNYIMGGDNDLVTFLQRAVGHSLTGDTAERCLFLLYGTGRNGKSTFLHVIREMLGGYALHARSETIMAKRGDGVPCDLARLKGARLVTFSEVEQGRKMFVSRVKEMCGGTDPITARFMRQNEFSFNPEFKPWIATNHKPAITDDTDSIWDRLFTIPFTVRVPDERVDKGLPDKLLAELPGILAWAVRGCLAWQDMAGLNAPAAVRAANEAYRVEMDTFAGWQDECCITGLDSMQARGGDLRASYEGWCKDNSVQPIGSRKFGERLGEQFRKGTSGGGFKTYFGIGLRGDL
jgi:putative DNA primase/helicase